MERVRRALNWLKSHKLRVIAGLVLVVLAVQFIYPADRLLPWTRIDGYDFGGQPKTQAVAKLNKLYAADKLHIKFGNYEGAVAKTVSFGAFGVRVDNRDRLEAVSYPWWLRLMPTSLAWGGLVIDIPTPTAEKNQKAFDRFILDEGARACTVAPENASLILKDGALRPKSAKSGARCDPNDLRRKLAKVAPSLGRDDYVTVDASEVAPAVSTKTAAELAATINDRVAGGLPFEIAGTVTKLPTAEVLAWLDFKVDQDILTPSINAERAGAYLSKNVAAKVARPAGVTKITTYDFAVVSRVDGPSGAALDAGATAKSVLDYLLRKTDAVPAARTMPVPPSIEYTRTYSPTDSGLAALFQQFDADHNGSFGVALIELSGNRRHASYNGDKQQVTASTYKLYVAYSTLKRVESGAWHWSDNINGGRNLAQCFDDMIVKSDNACAETLLQKIGYQAITDEVHRLGLNGTTFMKGNSPLTTPNDLATFLASLETGQLVDSDSRARLIDAMKRNIYRQGIPAGVSGTVADKVGFLNALLHDAAIIYQPGRTYVLVIMSDGSSWSTIADLARRADTLLRG